MQKFFGKTYRPQTPKKSPPMSPRHQQHYLESPHRQRSRSHRAISDHSAKTKKPNSPMNKKVVIRLQKAQDQVKKLFQKLKVSEKQIRTYKARCQQLQKKCNQLNDQNRQLKEGQAKNVNEFNLKMKLDNERQKIQKLQTEVQMLNRKLREEDNINKKNSEHILSQQQRERIVFNEKQKRSRILVSELSEQIKLIKDELHQKKIQCADLLEARKRSDSERHMLDQYQQKLESLVVEVERLNSLIQEKDRSMHRASDQLHKTRQRNYQLENELQRVKHMGYQQQDYASIRMKNPEAVHSRGKSPYDSHYGNSNSRNLSPINKSKDSAGWEVKNLKYEITKYKQDIEKLNLDLRHYKNLYEQRQKELELIRTLNGQKEINQYRMRNLQQQNVKLRRQLQNLSYQSRKSYKGHSESNFRSVHQTLEDELKQLKRNPSGRRQQILIEDCEKKQRILRSCLESIEELKLQNRNKSQRNEQYMEKNTILSNENQILKQEMEHLIKQMASMKGEESLASHRSGLSQQRLFKAFKSSKNMDSLTAKKSEQQLRRQVEDLIRTQQQLKYKGHQLNSKLNQQYQLSASLQKRNISLLDEIETLKKNYQKEYKNTEILAAKNILLSVQIARLFKQNNTSHKNITNYKSYSQLPRDRH